MTIHHLYYVLFYLCKRYLNVITNVSFLTTFNQSKNFNLFLVNSPTSQVKVFDLVAQKPILSVKLTIVLLNKENKSCITSSS